MKHVPHPGAKLHFYQGRRIAAALGSKAVRTIPSPVRQSPRPTTAPAGRPEQRLLAPTAQPRYAKGGDCSPGNRSPYGGKSCSSHRRCDSTSSRKATSPVVDPAVQPDLFRHRGAATTRPGHGLPSTRRLAMQTGCTATQSAKGLRQLENDGVVEAMAGSGIMCADQARSPARLQGAAGGCAIASAPTLTGEVAQSSTAA